MNKTVKEKWINALTSGEYKQTKDVLCRINSDGSKSYCCLGVLTDLYQKECDTNTELKKLEESIEFPTSPSEKCIGYGDLSRTVLISNQGTLSNSVVEWSELSNRRGYFNDGEHNSLSRQNDNGKTFEEIAEIINTYF